MKIFLSYSSKNRAAAEEVQYALLGDGHDVFFDRSGLPAGGDYQARINAAIAGCELFVFLITPDSVRPDSYALAELEVLKQRWKHPKDRVIPVLLLPTPMADIPAYLKAVTLLEPVGNVPAAVRAAVQRMATEATPGTQAGAAMPAPAAQPPAPSGGVSRPVLALGAAAVLLAVALFVYLKPGADPETARLESLVEAANAACVSNTESESGAKASANLDLLLKKVKGEGGVSEYKRKHVGADKDLPKELQTSENAQIRECMRQYMPAILQALGVEVSSSYPNPLQLRFTHKQPGDGAVPLDNTVRISLIANRRVFEDERLVEQAGGFYSYNAPYPTEEHTMRGSLTRQVLDARRETQNLASRFCLTRPKALQPYKDLYVHLECPPGAECQVGDMSPRWLDHCPPQPAKGTSQGFSLFATAFAAPAVAQARRWVVPSAKTLQAHPERFKEVGYTLFDISTDAFRDPAIIGVEVGVSVNGEAVDEDGLAPPLRPVANDARAGFKHRFALQALNFQGQQGGCDAVRLSLRPLRADGKAGPEQAVTLAYVALRSKASETLPLGKGQLTWSAQYVIPPAEWSHIALFNSFSYRVGDAAGAARQRQAADDAKRRFDALLLAVKGQQLVAVIRPPLTPSGGSLAFGLAAGIIEASGQVRFSHSFADADRIADALLAARAASREAAALINRSKYLYKVAGNAERQQRMTPDGLCAHVQPG